MYVTMDDRMTHTMMTKAQVYLPQEELAALRVLARHQHRRIADLVREAVRTVWLSPAPTGPVGISDGELRATSIDHDSAFDEI